MTRSVVDLLFRPRSVVVYGASSDPDKLSGRPLDYLKKFGYAGSIYAVNPKRKVVQGVPAYADIDEIAGPVDLAIIVVPAESVEAAVVKCAAAHVGAAIIFASGFAEIGSDGSVVQDRISAVAREAGMRLLGPNCLGSFSAVDRAFATFSTAFDDDGDRPDSPIALVSQSGAVGTFTYSTMNSHGLGVRYFANTGNQSDISVVELLAALSEEDDIDVLLGHLEGFTDPVAFESLARKAADRNKALVVLKAGKSVAGARAVSAHTASEAGDDVTFSQIAEKYGVIRVGSMEEMADTALGFGNKRLAGGSRLTIVTLSGGAGALAADDAADSGLVVDTWQSSTDREVLSGQLPYFGSTLNPIDVTGSMINDIGILRRTLDVVLHNSETDLVLIVLGNADKGSGEIVEALVQANQSTSKPFFVAWTGGSGTPRRALLKAGIPTYSDPKRAVQVLGHLVRTRL